MEAEFKFSDKKPKKRNFAESACNRPPTPTEVIIQREQEWKERQRQRTEKQRRRHQDVSYWNNDAMAENESFCKFTNLIDQVLDQVENLDIAPDSEITAEILLDRALLDELRVEAQKLKSWRKLNKVHTDRLIKLLTVLEKNIRDVLTDDGALNVDIAPPEMGDESDEALRELIDERLFRSLDAASVALTIMTSPKMPKQVLMEDPIERSIQLCKQYLDALIYPVTSSSTFKNFSKNPRKGGPDGDAKKRRLNDASGPFNVTMYMRLVDLVACFSELARFQTLGEVIMVQLYSLATPPFFFDNVPEIQVQAIKLLSTVFAKCPLVRKNILYDLINSLHRLPVNRSPKNCYQLSPTESISNFTVLILQLVQATVKLPPPKKHTASDDLNETNQDDIDLADQFILDSYDEAKRMASFFLGGFLTKCTAKSEDDFRRLFEQFLQDVLSTLYRPEWPVAELVLMILANILVKNIKEKTYDISLRVASLDYLGTITARLRKDRVEAIAGSNATYEKSRLEMVVKSILYDESNDLSKSVEEVDISHLSSTEKVRKMEQALFDYIIGTKCVGIGINCTDSTGNIPISDGDVSIEYVLTFYTVEWYRETVLDMEVMKERYKGAMKQGLQQKEIHKFDKKLERIMEKGANMKEFILGLMDRRHLKRRMQLIAKTNNIMIDSDANWVVKYLASKKELRQSFDVYLEKILNCFSTEYPVAIRTKAMKCLAQTVEADHQVLMIEGVNKIVQDRLIDANAAVRDATFELIGKFLVSRPDLLSTYYSILINRIKDTAVAVRKRVIRILKDIVKDNPECDQRAEILAEIVQRINDEEGVKKLCLETFFQLWFQPLRDTEKSELNEKIMLIVDTANICVREGVIEQFETLVSTLIKETTERATVYASKQIVDALVDCVLSLDAKIANDEQKIDADSLEQNQLDSEKVNQSRLLASLTTLSVFAKARPELLIRHAEVFIPYLSISVSSTIEFRVLNQMISMLEQVVPLLEHPSETLIRQLDTRLNDVVRDGGMVLIASAISCMSAIYNKFKKGKPGICNLFLVYLKYLSKLKIEMENNPGVELSAEKKPTIMRSLYSIGLMCRYFNFDDLFADNPEVLSIFGPCSRSGSSTPTKRLAGSGGENTGDGDEAKEQLGILHSQVFNILFYFSRNREYGICQKALISLGNLAAGSSAVLWRLELKNMYMVLLNAEKAEYLQLKIQVLKNLSAFLYAEEEKALKRSEQFKKSRENQQLEATELNLKEMELSTSGLSSSVIQQYWNAILNCYFHSEDAVRLNAAQVTWQTLEQGLVTPGSSIPTLVAMSTDPIQSIRVRIELLIKDMNTKYKGMIVSKAIPGVRLTFQLHKKLRNNPHQLIRGLRHAENPFGGKPSDQRAGTLPKLSNDTHALLANFYLGIRGNRQQRRSFLSAALRLFSEDAKEKLEIDEWVFIADNLAHFPYQVMDEPLYVIHQADSIISISGQNILGNFKQLLLPDSNQKLAERPSTRQLRQSTGAGNTLDISRDEADEEFSAEYIYEHLPDDKTQIYELKRNSQACFILLHLKTYLMRMYGFKEEKVQEYSPSEQANVYEKAIVRKNVPIFSPDSVLSEMQPSKATLKSSRDKDPQWKLAEDFHKFYDMLLCVQQDDQRDDSTMDSTVLSAASSVMESEPADA